MPFGDKKGLYGWLLKEDSLFVVSDAVVTHAIDLDEHVRLYEDFKPDVQAQKDQLLLPPIEQYLFTNRSSRTPWEWIALGFLALIGIVVWSRQKLKPMAGELKNMTKQIQVVEYFSRNIFRSSTAEDILWDITAKPFHNSTLTVAKCTCSPKTNECGFKRPCKSRAKTLPVISTNQLPFLFKKG